MRVKRVLESVAAAAALVLLAPLMGVIAVLVALDSRGPVFYGHDREGWRGRRFRCLKFRTMYVGAQERERELRAHSQVDGPQFKIDRDPRTTTVGRLLRATSLDELPQLINVVRGEMALVGPRPSPFRENQLCVDWRTGRLSVRPGITGLWQVCRHDRSEGDFHQWIEYDLLYVRHMSPALDLRIVFATVLSLGGRRSVPVSWLLGRA
jgi:lipopolysaccharide/colanic/teichoic acid biosynthesis glycosyltransferase